MKTDIEIIMEMAKDMDMSFKQDISVYNAEQLLIVFVANMKGMCTFNPSPMHSAEEMDIMLSDEMSDKGITISQEEYDIIYRVSPYYRALQDILLGLKGFTYVTDVMSAEVKKTSEEMKNNERST